MPNRIAGYFLTLAALFLLPAAAAAGGPWTRSASLAVREAYDDNLLLKDEGDQARRRSWATTFAPGLSAAFQSAPAFKALLGFSADVVRYHSEPGENNSTQRFTANFSGKTDQASWEVLNGLVWIDGSAYGPTYTGDAQVPALGGIPVRDRREAVVMRHSVKATRSFGKAFARPQFSLYDHDFRTWQLTRAGYENFVDRREFSGGFDAGCEPYANTRFFLGYRIGRQEQGPLNNAGSPYTNNYHRTLAGAEGSPAGWVKFSVAGGPDFRFFSSSVPANFKRRPTLFYYDASVSLTPTAQDTLTLASRRFAQPAFSSQSVYEDVVHEVVYKRKLGGKLTAGAGFKVYAGLWLQPVERRDYIYTPSVSLAYVIGKGLSADLSYLRDVAVNASPNNVDGRQFKRHLVSAGLKYSL
jgi:hypothetical protein